MTTDDVRAPVRGENAAVDNDARSAYPPLVLCWRLSGAGGQRCWLREGHESPCSWPDDARGSTDG